MISYHSISGNRKNHTLLSGIRCGALLKSRKIGRNCIYYNCDNKCISEVEVEWLSFLSKDRIGG